jgi:cytidylate kinase
VSKRYEVRQVWVVYKDGELEWEPNIHETRERADEEAKRYNDLFDEDPDSDAEVTT